MNGKRDSTEEKIRILRAVDDGASIMETCREKNISDATFHRWRQQIGHINLNDARRLKELERENTELKKMLAAARTGNSRCSVDLSLDPRLPSSTRREDANERGEKVRTRYQEAHALRLATDARHGLRSFPLLPFAEWSGPRLIKPSLLLCYEFSSASSSFR